MMRNKKAFTLIELLVVVLVIGILSAVALPQYNFTVEKTRFAEARTVASSLQKAINVWLLENGGGPASTVAFLGDNANGSGLLSVDMETGLDCSKESGTQCAGKNFRYSALCSTSHCYTFVSRFINNEKIYTVEWTKAHSGSWQGGECDYYPSTSPIGGKICQMLETQEGNGFYSCEDC